MEFIRTFHPVGQGAFYSERHKHKNEEFTIVYDCGSMSLGEEKLKKLINSSFQKKHKIDILFISHFHADHINGIEYLKNHCTIKNVVLPLLDSDTKTLLKIYNYIEMDYLEEYLIDNPTVFFGDKVNIITINPVEYDRDDNSPDFDNAINLSTNRANRNLESGKSFKLSQELNWFYIPFNYEQSERKNQFLKELKRNNIELSNINKIDNVIKYKSEILNAYTEVKGNLNENSMVVFSGQNIPVQIKNFLSLYYYHHHCFHHYFRINCNCLYTGDINLKSKKIFNNLSNKLGKLLTDIGTFQIPHHGSINNFNKSIFQNKECCAIISFGTQNKYSHPSDKVVEDILSEGSLPYFVTEDKSTIVVQFYRT